MERVAIVTTNLLSTLSNAASAEKVGIMTTRFSVNLWTESTASADTSHCNITRIFSIVFHFLSGTCAFESHNLLLKGLTTTSLFRFIIISCTWPLAAHRLYQSRREGVFLSDSTENERTGGYFLQWCVWIWDSIVSAGFLFRPFCKRICTF